MNRSDEQETDGPQRRGGASKQIAFRREGDWFVRTHLFTIYEMKT